MLEELTNGLQWHNCVITFIYTPGHSPGSVCVRINENLFTGDTLIPDMKTVRKLPESSLDALKQTMKGLQLLKGQNLVVHPGHGNSVLFDEYDLNKML